MIRHIARWALALGLAFMGVLHFVQTRGFRGLIPDWATRMTRLDKDGVVVASGAAELALAAGLIALPRERARIGWATAAFFVAVFPGNVRQWRTHHPAPGLDTDTKRLVRLFLQPVLILWALWSTDALHTRSRR
ncbi:DoxX family protein [Microbacterium sp.]|uniref:DoxX family protein n=1 Tax=Microbacterium sp. TaxID=51671 RepID=UPI003F94FCEA